MLSNTNAFILQQYSLNDRLHVSAQEGHHRALYKIMKGNKMYFNIFHIFVLVDVNLTTSVYISHKT